MKKSFWVIIFSLLVSCKATESVISNYDETIDFNAYSTFVICVDDLFVENTSFPNYDNNMVREFISNAVEKEMIDFGHKTNVLNPQLQAGFKITIEEQQNTFKNCDYNNSLDYWQNCTICTETYTEETLIVYVSDIKKNQVIWQGSINCSLNKPKKSLENYINSIVNTLFKHYPKSK